MACTITKMTQIQRSCSNGTWHEAVFRLWSCTAQVGGINYQWTEWRIDTPWVDTQIACSGSPTDTPLEEIQIAIVGDGSQQQPVSQRLHQFTVMIQGVGPMTWVNWIDQM